VEPAPGRLHSLVRVLQELTPRGHRVVVRTGPAGGPLPSNLLAPERLRRAVCQAIERRFTHPA
jgi:hypothetical protein